MTLQDVAIVAALLSIGVVTSSFVIQRIRPSPRHDTETWLMDKLKEDGKRSDGLEKQVNILTQRIGVMAARITELERQLDDERKRNDVLQRLIERCEGVSSAASPSDDARLRVFLAKHFTLADLVIVADDTGLTPPREAVTIETAARDMVAEARRLNTVTILYDVAVEKRPNVPKP